MIPACINVISASSDGGWGERVGYPAIVDLGNCLSGSPATLSTGMRYVMTDYHRTHGLLAGPVFQAVVSSSCWMLRLVHVTRNGHLAHAQC